MVGGGVPEAGGADGPIGVLDLGQVGAEVRIVVGLRGEEGGSLVQFDETKND